MANLNNFSLGGLPVLDKKIKRTKTKVLVIPYQAPDKHWHKRATADVCKSLGLPVGSSSLQVLGALFKRLHPND